MLFITRSNRPDLTKRKRINQNIRSKGYDTSNTNIIRFKLRLFSEISITDLQRTLTSLSAPPEASRHFDPTLQKSTLNTGSFPCQAISGVFSFMIGHLWIEVQSMQIDFQHENNTSLRSRRSPQNEFYFGAKKYYSIFGRSRKNSHLLIWKLSYESENTCVCVASYPKNLQSSQHVGQTDVDFLLFSRYAADTDLPKLLQKLRLQRQETADRFKNYFVHADSVSRIALYAVNEPMNFLLRSAVFMKTSINPQIVLLLP